MLKFTENGGEGGRLGENFFKKKFFALLGEILFGCVLVVSEREDRFFKSEPRGDPLVLKKFFKLGRGEELRWGRFNGFEKKVLVMVFGC